MNYFNYFTEIEDAFIRRRGKHLLLSPMDWALIESWKEMNIPLHVALRGIEKSFDSWESRPRKRTIKSLLYCQEEVAAQYAEWLESRIGSAEDENQPNGAQSKGAEDAPFSRTAILEHLRRGKSALIATGDARKRIGPDDLSEALDRAAVQLSELEQDFADAVAPNPQRLELSLSSLERMLSDALRLTVNSEQLDAIKSEVKSQLKTYRKHMEPSAYQQTFDNLVLKRLREQFGIPRLSLFYL